MSPEIEVNAMREYEALPFAEERYGLGESPFYDPRYRRLSWVDISSGRLYELMDGKQNCYDFEEPIGAAIPLKDSSGFLVAGKSCLWKFEEGKKEMVCDLTSLYEPWQRSNDAKADPFGRIFFGSSKCVEDHEDGGNLFRFAGGTVTCVQKDTKISNGMAWNRDRTKFFFSDSLCHGIFVYDYDSETGDISDRRMLFAVEDGVSDGMCIDSRDRLWTAIWGGNRVECRNSETGELEAVIHVPAKHVTSCCFYGEKLDELFITTSGDQLTGEGDGRLYHCKAETCGVPMDYADIHA